MQSIDARTQLVHPEMLEGFYENASGDFKRDHLTTQKQLNVGCYSHLFG